MIYAERARRGQRMVAGLLEAVVMTEGAKGLPEAGAAYARPAERDVVEHAHLVDEVDMLEGPHHAQTRDPESGELRDVVDPRTRGVRRRCRRGPI